jgi:hypothetical protein
MKIMFEIVNPRFGVLSGHVNPATSGHLKSGH